MRSVESKLNALEKKVFAKGTIKQEDRIHVFYGTKNETAPQVAALKDKLCKKYSLSIEEVEKEIFIITIQFTDKEESNG